MNTVTSNDLDTMCANLIDSGLVKAYVLYLPTDKVDLPEGHKLIVKAQYANDNFHLLLIAYPN